MTSMQLLEPSAYDTCKIWEDLGEIACQKST
jgi:hypothetical protein